MNVDAVIVAGGGGRRAGGKLPKQFRPLAGQALMRWSVEVLATDSRVRRTVVVVAAKYEKETQKALRDLNVEILPAGGTIRQKSVLAGLEALESNPPDAVLVHDAARPKVGSKTVTRLLDALEETPAAVPGLSLTDTLKEADAEELVFRTLPRDDIRAVQTPQAFRYIHLLNAHRAAAANGQNDSADDATLIEAMNGKVRIVPGDPLAHKVTDASDFSLVGRLLSPRAIRIGQGIDIHRFGAGNSLRLLGIDVPHGFGLEGHSDADVGFHAVVDAILGALSEGDIGEHFPPGDPCWKNADSNIFVAFARQRAEARGAEIGHVDVTILCETPKIAPHREKMQTSLASALGIPLEGTSVKATTSEGIGLTGKGEGIAAFALATLIVPKTPKRT